MTEQIEIIISLLSPKRFEVFEIQNWEEQTWQFFKRLGNKFYSYTRTNLLTIKLLKMSPKDTRVDNCYFEWAVVVT